MFQQVAFVCPYEFNGNEIMSSRNHIAVFASLFLTLVIDNMGVGLIFPVLSTIFAVAHNGILPDNASLALRDILYSVTLGGFGVGMFIGAPILGDLSDQIGRKKVLLLCLTGTALGFFICALGISFNHVSWLIFGRLLGGLMAGSMPIAQAAIIDISTPENKIKNISLITFALCLGFAVGPMLGGYFSNHDIFPWFSYATPFYAATILALLNASSLFFTFKETFIPPAERKLNLFKGPTLFIEAFRHTKIRNLTLMSLLQQLGWSLYFQFISLFLVQEYHYNSVRIGHFMSYMGVWFGLTMLIIIRIFSRLFKEEILNLGCVIMVSFCAIYLIFNNHATAQWVIAAPYAVCIAMSYATTLTLLSNLASKDEQGWIMGVSTSVMAGAWGITGFLAGTLAYVSSVFPFIIVALLMTGSMLLMVNYYVRHRKINESFHEGIDSVI